MQSASTVMLPVVTQAQRVPSPAAWHETLKLNVIRDWSAHPIPAHILQCLTESVSDLSLEIIGVNCYLTHLRSTVFYQLYRTALERNNLKQANKQVKLKQ